MKYLIVNWMITSNTANKLNLLEKIKNHNYDVYILDASHEWEYWHKGSILHDIVGIISSQGKKLNVIAGGHIINKPVLPDVIVHHYDTYWIKASYGLLPNTEDYSSTNYNHHYIYLNNRGHEWRCHLMDLVAKNRINKNIFSLPKVFSLLEYGAVSWHNGDAGGIFNYPWKYFTPTKMSLTDSFNTHTEGTDKIFQLPVEYKNSFAQLISETSDNAFFLTEKTAIPLLLGKPFLVASVPEFHKFLTELKFELYTEIFDYSFDQVADRETRYEMLLKNFIRLCSIPKKDLVDLYLKIQPKIERNKKHAITIANTYEPEILKNLPKHMLNSIEWQYNNYTEFEV
jgi:hypothetical protein